MRGLRMGSVMKSETKIIGKDVWWDTNLQEFREKRLNLTKVPLKFRCPSCGKIVVKPRDRRPLMVKDEKDWKIKQAEIDRFFKLEKPPRSEWDEFVERHKEFFEVKTIEIPWNPTWFLSFYGGVCKDCYLDGFGASGGTGKFMGMMIKGEDEKRKKKREKNEGKTSLWINGKLVLVDRIIEPEYTLIENVQKDGGA